MNTNFILALSKKSCFYLQVLMTIIVVNALNGQQNTGFRESLVSPVINGDGSATFKLYAPLAKEVAIQGDWASEGGKGVLIKGEKGIWSFTTKSLPSDLYQYTFIIDSVRTLDPANPFSYRDVGNLFSIFIIKGGNGDYYAVQNVKHGNVIKQWYTSAKLQSERRLTIYTPPGYESGSKRYPVLYLLHGSGGDEEAWNDLGRVPQILDNLIAEGKAVPMIVVMPNGNPGKQAAPGETSENFEYKPVMSQFLPNFRQGSYEMSFDEIVRFIDNNYRTIPKKSSRAIAGLSMGGFHSILISANHPKLFDYIGPFSPGVPAPNLDASYLAYADLDNKFKQQKNIGFKSYWIAIGKTDFLYEPVSNFRKRLDQLQFPYTYFEGERGHIWSNWRQYMLQFTPTLFKK